MSFFKRLICCSNEQAIKQEGYDRISELETKRENVMRELRNEKKKITSGKSSQIQLKRVKNYLDIIKTIDSNIDKLQEAISMSDLSVIQKGLLEDTSFATKMVKRIAPNVDYGKILDDYSDTVEDANQVMSEISSISKEHNLASGGGGEIDANELLNELGELENMYPDASDASELENPWDNEETVPLTKLEFPSPPKKDPIKKQPIFLTN